MQRLQNEIVNRMQSMKDHELRVLMSCFVDNTDEFSAEFLNLFIKTLKKKIPHLELQTLIMIVWDLSKLLTNESGKEHLEILKEIGKYERLRDNLGNLKPKSLCILMWTFTRHPDLFNLELIDKIAETMLLSN